jgi:hypothetical protein
MAEQLQKGKTKLKTVVEGLKPPPRDSKGDTILDTIQRQMERIREFHVESESDAVEEESESEW